MIEQSWNCLENIPYVFSDELFELQLFCNIREKWLWRFISFIQVTVIQNLISASNWNLEPPEEAKHFQEPNQD